MTDPSRGIGNRNNGFTRMNSPAKSREAQTGCSSERASSLPDARVIRLNIRALLQLSAATPIFIAALSHASTLHPRARRLRRPVTQSSARWAGSRYETHRHRSFRTARRPDSYSGRCTRNRAGASARSMRTQAMTTMGTRILFALVAPTHNRARAPMSLIEIVSVLVCTANISAPPNLHNGIKELLLAVRENSRCREASPGAANPIEIEPDTRNFDMTIQNNLSGKTTLVTGASRGIGRATALALARAGAQVIVHYSTGEKEATAVVADIHSAGGKAEKVTADLRATNGPHLLAKRVRALVGCRLDILVANAGIAKAASIEETTVEDFDALFAVNVRAPFFLVQQLLPVMRKGSGVILLSSLAAHAAVGNLPAYSATKGAIDTLVKHFASALGERGIRVNAVAPGVVQTEMSKFAATDAGRDFTLGMQAFKRLATPEDIAAAITFLASDQSQWITGHTLRVDGGSKL